MEVRDTLFHINWGDGDNCYIIAPDRETAISKMEEGRLMVNYVVKLDNLYQMILKAGIREVVEWIRLHPNVPFYQYREWQAQLKLWGIEG